MKISELNTKSFLGADNDAKYSYVLVNYAGASTSSQVTQKVTIEELGNSIARSLQLYKKTQNGPATLIRNGNTNNYIEHTENLGGGTIDVTADQAANYSYEIPDYDNEDSFDPITMSPSGAMLVFTTADSEPIQERPLLIWDAANNKAVPYNLANPFYIKENSSLISRGQNVFVDADSSSYDKLYVMTSAGPSEISIGGGGGSSNSGPIIETMQTTTNAVPNQGGAKDAAIVFTPVDMSGFFNGLYACDENGHYDLLNLTTNLLYTSIDDQNVHYQPLWTDGQGNLYYYDQDHWSQVTP